MGRVGVKKSFPETISYEIFETSSSFQFNRYFRDFFASISKILILAGEAWHWVIIVCGLSTFLIFPNFLRS